MFGFPDLYDTDGSSEGIGNWCLMAGGSWGAGGDTPTHPSAWCKANQGWVSVDNRTTNAIVNIPDVKSRTPSTGCGKTEPQAASTFWWRIGSRPVLMRRCRLRAC